MFYFDTMQVGELANIIVLLMVTLVYLVVFHVGYVPVSERAKRVHYRLRFRNPFYFETIMPVEQPVVVYEPVVVPEVVVEKKVSRVFRPVMPVAVAEVASAVAPTPQGPTMAETLVVVKDVAREAGRNLKFEYTEGKIALREATIEKVLAFGRGVVAFGHEYMEVMRGIVDYYKQTKVRRHYARIRRLHVKDCLNRTWEQRVLAKRVANSF